MSDDRTAEIWSTRLQRELVALTESQNTNDREDDSQSSKSKANDEIAMLPPFIRMKDNLMDIEKGICKVTFLLEVCPKVAESNVKQNTETNEESETKEDSETKQEPDLPLSDATVVTDLPQFVSITLDASMDTNAEGEVEPNPNTYPFQKPKAILTEGADLLPPGSDISNGDFLDVDCDWTPSLHLSDAVLNVALKIRESIRKSFPFKKVEMSSAALEERKGDSFLSRMGVSSWFTPTFTSSELEEVAGESSVPVDLARVQLGDTINLNDAPFNKCAGLYPCKAIRRPDFMEADIQQFSTMHKQQIISEEAAIDVEDENEISSGLGNYMMLQAGEVSKVAGAGISGAGSMFRSIAKSTKTVFEESYLMISDDFIIELRASKFSVGSATVIYIIPISLLAKLKFRRNESLSLFFKQASDDPYILMCPHTYDAVQQIQSVLKGYGVKGKHTNAATQRLTQEALMMVYDVQTKEKLLLQQDDPSVDLVNEIMDLYRRAAEIFEGVGDPRHEEVMKHMHVFLAKPIVISLLDESQKKETSNERQQRDSSDIMKEADEILQQVTTELDPDGDIGNDTSLSETQIDSVKEIDAMLESADKELDDIMKS